MGQYLLKLPKMGESVAEATVTKWLMEVGDTVVLDDAIVEIATDKVDTDVTAEVEGVLIEKRIQENEVVAVGEVMAVIEIEGESPVQEPKKGIEEITESDTVDSPVIEEEIPAPEIVAKAIIEEIETVQSTTKISAKESAKFYSPLVRNIAQEEGVTFEALDSIQGTGMEQRVTKNDILAYIKTRKQTAPVSAKKPLVENKITQDDIAPKVQYGGGDQEDFYHPYFELSNKENIEDLTKFDALLRELEILLPTDSKEEVAYFTELFQRMMRLFTLPFHDSSFDFADAEFWNAISTLSKDFAGDSQLRKMNGNRGSKHFIYINRTFFGLYHLLYDLKAEIQTESFKQYL